VGHFHEKRAVERGVRDLGATVGKLDKVLLFLAGIIMVAIGLGLFGVTIASYLVTFGSLIVTLFVIIGNAARNIFESILFVFVFHPFDVGDRVEIDGQLLVVRHMDLNSTTFHRLDGQEINVTNPVLATKFIHNIRRSPHQSDAIQLELDLRTPSSKLDQIKKRMSQFLVDNKRDYYPTLSMCVNSIKRTDVSSAMGSGGQPTMLTTTSPEPFLQVAMYFKHRSNWQDGMKRMERRSRFLLTLKDVLLDLGVNISPSAAVAQTASIAAAVNSTL
jgi:small-conductance mechanosensitive channel